MLEWLLDKLFNSKMFEYRRIKLYIEAYERGKSEK